MVCAQRPVGFSSDASGVLPPSVRAKLAELMEAFGANADRLDRLTNFIKPGSCP
jgi:hypothetical protein